jgi:hypothetical protein
VVTLGQGDVPERPSCRAYLLAMEQREPDSPQLPKVLSAHVTFNSDSYRGITAFPHLKDSKIEEFGVYIYRGRKSNFKLQPCAGSWPFSSTFMFTPGQRWLRVDLRALVPERLYCGNFKNTSPLCEYSTEQPCTCLAS